jgi:hypothetical protein
MTLLSLLPPIRHWFVTSGVCYREPESVTGNKPHRSMVQDNLVTLLYAGVQEMEDRIEHETQFLSCLESHSQRLTEEIQIKMERLSEERGTLRECWVRFDVGSGKTRVFRGICQVLHNGKYYVTFPEDGDERIFSPADSGILLGDMIPATGDIEQNYVESMDTLLEVAKRHTTHETKRNETKRNETKRNETKRNETKRNETKRN